MNKRANNIVFGILLALITIIIGSIISHYSHFKPSEGENDTIVKVHYDTVYHTVFKVVEKPKVVNKTIIKYDTIFQSKDTSIALPIVRKYHKDTIFFTENDTAIIETTIVGINPSIERINMLLKKRQINQTTEKTIIQYKKQKGFYIAPNIGVGYGVINKKPDLYIGVGIGYKF